MIEVKAMTSEEMNALLERNNYGHLGCARDNHPYVVPMHYAYDGRDLYFFTTEGTKTEFMAANREVCFQVEEVTDASRWRSVMVTGGAGRITKPDETEHAMQLITERNPTLTPALNKTKIGAWKRLNNIVIYRVRPHAIYGRKTFEYAQQLVRRSSNRIGRVEPRAQINLFATRTGGKSTCCTLRTSLRKRRTRYSKRQTSGTSAARKTASRMSCR